MLWKKNILDLYYIIIYPLKIGYYDFIKHETVLYRRNLKHVDLLINSLFNTLIQYHVHPVQNNPCIFPVFFPCAFISILVFYHFICCAANISISGYRIFLQTDTEEQLPVSIVRRGSKRYGCLDQRSVRGGVTKRNIRCGAKKWQPDYKRPVQIERSTKVHDRKLGIIPVIKSFANWLWSLSDRRCCMEQTNQYMFSYV